MSSALVAAGAALAASLITGVLTWLAGRSHMALQLADQQDVRREQLRREVYARCIELLMVKSSQLLTWTRDGWDGAEASLEAMRDRHDEMSSQSLSRVAELSMVGPRFMVGLYTRTRGKMDGLQEDLEEVLSAAAPRPSGHPVDLLETPVREAGAALEAFCEAARQVLEFDELDHHDPHASAHRTPS
ncbi:hypothetical protein [Streptomyces sp. BH105]|uniref:hypothetical protein n=1 Tax=Streptomyces sp. BH105 TaxID=3410408 RepID=UPI003CE6AB23